VFADKIEDIRLPQAEVVGQRASRLAAANVSGSQLVIRLSQLTARP
jgi:hypothetical protein